MIIQLFLKICVNLLIRVYLRELLVLGLAGCTALLLQAARAVAGVFLARIKELMPALRAEDSVCHTIHEGLVELTRARKAECGGMAHQHILKELIHNESTHSDHFGSHCEAQ